MKWLFAILVALNIIVFGSMVAGKLIKLPTPVAATPAPAPTVANPPPTPVITVSETTNPASVPLPTPIDGKTRTSNKTESKAKTENKGTDKNTADKSSPTDSRPAANCSANAVLPEDDYHRIKGLLSRWPHAASRFVEQNHAPAKTTNSKIRYMVAIDGGAEMRERLKEQGFSNTVHNGQLSLGIFNRRSDAEALLARAKINGFSQAQITQLGGRDGDNNTLSVAKMRVTFIQVDDQAAADIGRVIQPYARLQRGSCKK